MDVWNEGQRYKSVRKDWDAVKVQGLIRDVFVGKQFLFLWMLQGGDDVSGEFGQVHAAS